MNDKLSVRAYNVGLGDCLYLQVPDANQIRHILIDCGSLFGEKAELQNAIRHLKESLPPAQANGKKRLDLLVVTSRNEDHIKGFDPAWFADIQIDHIWLSAALDKNHPQAQKHHALQLFAKEILADFAAQELSGEFGDLVRDLRSLNNDRSLTAVCETLPQNNGLEPLFVHAGTPQPELRLFDDPGIQLHVLAPVDDIDGTYLDNAVDELLEFHGHVAGKNEPGLNLQPANISAFDFQNLLKSMQSRALSIVFEAQKLAKNTSVVLLLEWQGRRLLFPSDAQYKRSFNGQYREGTSNGSWNVMWSTPAIKAKLALPLNFLMVGEHGSQHATPWVKPERTIWSHPGNDILDALLPLPPAGGDPAALALVSTRRTRRYPATPERHLMEELGKRVINTRQYDEPDVEGYKISDEVSQPLRTDQERGPAGERVSYLEVELSAQP